jgi:hypothetical protein
MYTENSLSVKLIASKSTATSTAVPTAVDMGPYFNVGKRECKFIIGYVAGTTASGNEQVVITIEECASTATASFTTMLGPDGSSGTWTSTACGSTLFEWHGNITKQYIRAKFTSAGTTPKNGIIVYALPTRRGI